MPPAMSGLGRHVQPRLERPDAGLPHLVPKANVALLSNRDPVETDRMSGLTTSAH